MKSNQILNSVLTVILVLCAIIITVLVVKRELFNNKYTPKVRTVQNWRTLVDDGHQIGTSNASVYIIEFTDYECPYCKILKKNIDSILVKYKDKVALIVYNFPLEIHSHAFDLALGGECAARQNKFKSYYDSVFNYSVKFEKLNLSHIAFSAGITDTASFMNCIESRTTFSIVNNDIEKGKEIDIEGTPTIIINGKLYEGSLTVKQLENAVIDALNN